MNPSVPSLPSSIGDTPTLARQVFGKIRADILRCRLLPGERLRLDELRARYSISFSPLREALMRLETEGLVKLEDKRGFRVASVSRSHLEDIARCRADIESLALRASIERGGVDWEARLLSIFHRFSHTAKADAAGDGQMSGEWAMEHRLFHIALISACGSPTMISLWEAMFDQFERYVALSIAYRMVPRDDIREHRQIMNAAMGRNPEEAERLCRGHIERTKEKVLRSEALLRDDGPTFGEIGIGTKPSRHYRTSRRNGRS
jgi:DNA-binding GntR family transcriptional regulator